MLSESHPLYLQNLHIDLVRARIKREFTMFVLALVTVVAVPPLVIVGMCILHNCSWTSQVIELNDHRNSLDERYRAPQYQWRIMGFWGGPRDCSVYSNLLSELGKVLVGECEAGRQVGVNPVEGGVDGFYGPRVLSR
jgi:hypothetical protein